MDKCVYYKIGNIANKQVKHCIWKVKKEHLIKHKSKGRGVIEMMSDVYNKDKARNRR